MPRLRLPRPVIARIANNIPEAIRAFEDLFETVDLKQDLLVSGVNIKTINGQSVVGPGDLVVTVASVPWTSITGTPDTLAGYGITDAATAAQGVLADSALQPGDAIPQADVTGLVADLAGKQETLVSGTNIKTVNGNSLLGSGDVVVSGGGATGGTAVISFGAAPGTNIIETVVTGQTGITAGARVRAWVQGDTTADHSDFVHSRIFAGHVSLSATDIIAGVGFTIVAATQLRLTGDIACRWEWV